MKKSNYDNGSVNGWMIAAISLIVVSVGLAAFGIWSFMNYNQQKTNVDTKINSAVATAEKNQADADEAKFAEREKDPNRQFVGPDDYGRVTFDYPKTWSVYVASDVTNGGTYQAYLNPVTVPPVNGNSSQQFALRVEIEQEDYNEVVSSYDSLVESGDLKSSNISANGNNGVRLDGSFSQDIRGSAVIFKIRDKTLIVSTDADTFESDFNNIVATIKYNQ